MPRRSSRLLVAALVVLAAGTGVAGCGGSGDGPDTAQDQAAITRMLKTGLGTSDPAILCSRTLSTGLAARIFGTPSLCLSVQGQAASGRVPPTAVQVTGVQVNGDRATATVRLRGGDEDGTVGPVSLAREKAGWRLSDLSTSFLRSELTAAITSDRTVDRRLGACVTRALATLDDRSMRHMAFGAMSGDAQAQQQLAALVNGCLKAASSPAGGQSI